MQTLGFVGDRLVQTPDVMRLYYGRMYLIHHEVGVGPNRISLLGVTISPFARVRRARRRRVSRDERRQRQGT